MKIKYIGHSCFKVEHHGYEIIFDPYQAGSVPGYESIDESANMVICSHEHADHNGREQIEIAKTNNLPPKITTVETYHDDQRGKLRGMNNITIADFEDCRIAHLGDLGCGLTNAQVAQLLNMDILMIPVGGYFTIDYRQACQIIDQLQPKIVVPMHYRDSSLKIGYPQISDVSDFLSSTTWKIQKNGPIFEYEAQSDLVVAMTPQNVAVDFTKTA